MKGLRIASLVVALAGVFVLSLLPAEVTAQPTTRTWVVDAVDEENGEMRFESVDTGTSEVTVEVGDTVRWEFDRAKVGHTVTNNSQNWSINEYRDPNGRFVEYTFSSVGEYRYLCSIHPMMTGLINVVPDAPVNSPPTGDPYVEPRSGPAPLYVHFQARATDPDGDPLTYRWNFGDGSPIQTEEHTHHSYAEPGTYTASLQVSDGRGGELNRSYEISVQNADGQSPTVNASANPTMGRAPLSVTFMAGGQDPQNDPLTFSWDFGDPGTDTDKATGNRVFYSYGQAGAYTATVTARDPGGNEGVDTVEITVQGDPTPPAPEIEALADPASGEAPLEVAFSTRLTTRGGFEPFAGGPAEYEGITGQADLSRSHGETVAQIHADGLQPNANYETRVHTQACATNQGGPGFRFDEDQPEGTPENEIRAPFTADGMGMGMGAVSRERRAGEQAVSVVIHDPGDNRRAACADLAPNVADLSYSWDFDGDGAEDSAEVDPTHTYVEPGGYAAEVTVSNAEGGEPVSDTVTVEVAETNEPPETEITAGPTGTTKYRSASFWFLSSEPGPGAGFECSMDDKITFSPCSAPKGYENLSGGTHTFRVRAVDAAGKADGSPASRTWTVDFTRPAVRALTPRENSTTRDRTPVIQASARDAQTDLARTDVRLTLDGRNVRTFTYDRARDVLRHVPQKALSHGSHTVSATATDAAGNTATDTWRFKVRRG